MPVTFTEEIMWGCFILFIIKSFSCERSKKTKAGGCLADLLFYFSKHILPLNLHPVFLNKNLLTVIACDNKVNPGFQFCNIDGVYSG